MIDEIALLEMANPIQQQQQQQSIDHTNEALHMTMYFFYYFLLFLFQIKTNDSTILRFILVFFFVQFIIILGRDEG